MGSMGVPGSVLLVVVLGSACGDAGIEEHAVPKGVERVPEGPVDASSGGGDPVEAMASNWVVPEGWTLDPEPRPMRVSTYLAPDEAGEVEVAVTRFPGHVGGELANINRWRGQMGLPPIDEAELEQTLTRFGSAGYAGYVARVESDAGVMLAAGVYDEAADEMWFVRATVADEAVADRLEADLFGMARSMAGLGKGGGG